MPFLLPNSQEEKLLFTANAFPVAKFKDWLLAQLLRTLRNKGNKDVDFDSDPLFVIFKVADYYELIKWHSLPINNSNATHIGFFFGNDATDISNPKFKNLTCFITLTYLEGNKYKRVTMAPVIEAGSGAINTEMKIENYADRIKKLRPMDQNDSLGFGDDERSGIHYLIADFEIFIRNIVSLGAIKDRFKSFFVRRNEEITVGGSIETIRTTALVHSFFDIEADDLLKPSLDSRTPDDDSRLFDFGTGCCQI